MKFIFKTIKRILLGIVILLVGGLAVMFISNPLLTLRILTLDLGPVEQVTGGQIIVVPTAANESRSISETALAAAIAFGEQNDSHALIVYHDQAIQLEHYFPGHDADSFSPTQSMHKSVLAMLIGIAIEQGYIASVDEPAATYLMEWADDARAGITIRHMLQQNSGIDFPTFGFNPLGGFFRLIFGPDIKPVALNQPLEVEPGSRFDYNSVNPQNLGLIVERATGKRYSQYLSEALWQRLGVPDATIVLDSEENQMARMFCCLNATARSWLHIGLLHLNEGRMAGRQLVPVDWMRQIVIAGQHNPNYGYLTWLGNEFEEYRYYNRKTS
ncbi:MAG: serine hydrolase, partial [Gammaproteobacteria bacterium]